MASANYCKSFAEFNAAEKDATSGWTLNKESADSVNQTHVAASTDIAGSNEVSCNVSSARSAATNSVYKLGDKLNVRTGYKVRATKDAKTSLYSVNTAAANVELLEGATTLFASAAVAVAALLAF